MTLVNTWEKLSSTTPIQPPLTQADIDAIQASQGRMNTLLAGARREVDTLSRSIDAVGRSINEVSQSIHQVREMVEEAHRSVRSSQPVEQPTLCQQIGDFIVTCCRSIGRLFTGRR